MGDVATNTAASNLRLTFSTNGTATIPQNTALTSGTYLPAHYQQNESLPAPAPAGPYGSDLNSLVGASPNGDWKLFVRDDTFPDGGSISGGWILLLETGPVISPIGPQTTRENTSLVIPFKVSDSDTIATNLVVTAVVTGTQNPPNLVLASNL